VPTMVGGGRIDPITPPRFSDLAASTIEGSFEVIFENSGHGATLQSDCGRQIFVGFLADPGNPPDPSCAAGVSTEYMVGTAAATLPVARMRAELSRVPMPPDMRRRLRRALQRD
jgi:TAP-like protein